MQVLKKIHVTMVECASVLEEVADNNTPLAFSSNGMHETWTEKMSMLPANVTTWLPMLGMASAGSEISVQNR